MHAVAGALIRRGFEAHNDHGDSIKINMPAWGKLTMVLTVVIFSAVLFMIEYTFGRIVPTLVMIEVPQESINFEPIPTEEADASINKDPEHAQTKPQLITSSFCRTIKHLQSKGGFRARFRGVSVYLVNAIAIQWIARLLWIVPFITYLPGLTAVIASVLCAPLSLAWTHIVISEPSPKPWFRRLPTLKQWKKIAGPTALFAVCEQLVVVLPTYLALATLTHEPEDLPNLPEKQQRAMIWKIFGISIFALVLAFLVVIPANVTLTRVQASLLNDTEETIVPFDRSFDGKVIPEIVGGSGMIGVLDAWKSFDWAARIRLIKTYLKVIAMQIAASIAFVVVILCQLFLICGKDLSKVIETVPGGHKN